MHLYRSEALGVDTYLLVNEWVDERINMLTISSAADSVGPHSLHRLHK